MHSKIRSKHTDTHRHTKIILESGILITVFLWVAISFSLQQQPSLSKKTLASPVGREVNKP